MAFKGWKSGNELTWTNPGSAVLAGDPVVVGKTIGIAAVDIAGSAIGELHMVGVFIVPKVTTAVITPGMNLLWDASARLFDVGTATPATGDLAGAVFAIEAAGNGVTTVKADFNRRIGVLT